MIKNSVLKRLRKIKLATKQKKLLASISDKDTAKLYVQFLDQNNPKSEY